VNQPRTLGFGPSGPPSGTRPSVLACAWSSPTGGSPRRCSTTAAVECSSGRSSRRSSPARRAARRWTETRLPRRTSATGRSVLPVLVQLAPVPRSTPGHLRVGQTAGPTVGRSVAGRGCVRPRPRRGRGRCGKNRSLLRRAGRGTPQGVRLWMCAHACSDATAHRTKGGTR